MAKLIFFVSVICYAKLRLCVLILTERTCSNHSRKARYSMCGHAHPWTFQNENHKAGIENSYQATVLEQKSQVVTSIYQVQILVC